MLARKGGMTHMACGPEMTDTVDRVDLMLPQQRNQDCARRVSRLVSNEPFLARKRISPRARLRPRQGSFSQRHAQGDRRRAPFGFANRTKMFHVKHFGTIGKAEYARALYIRRPLDE